VYVDRTLEAEHSQNLATEIWRTKLGETSKLATRQQPGNITEQQHLYTPQVLAASLPIL